MSEHEDFARFRTAIMVCLEPEPAQDALAFLDAMRARQARTIRRLFTAYFLAKGKAMRNGQAAADNCATCLVAGIEDGKREERARIVAALRENGGLGDMPNFTLRLDYACNVIADAIERGEL